MERNISSAQRELGDLEKKFLYLLEMGVSFAGDKDLSHLLESVLLKARIVTNSHAGSIFLVDICADKEGTKKELCFKAAQNDGVPNFHLSCSAVEFTLPFDKKSLAGYVAVTKKILNIHDVYQIDENDPYKFDPTFDKKIGYRTRSVLVVRIAGSKGETLGVLQLINRLDRRTVTVPGQTQKTETSMKTMSFLKQDIDMAVWVAGLAGVALENIYMLDELKDQNIKLDIKVQERTQELNNSLKELEKRNRQMENDLDIARKMQIGIVPQKETIAFLSQISLLGISSVFKPCHKLGGDFWDIMELHGEKIGIIMVDFSGHGIAPSLNTFRVKEFIHSLSDEIKTPAMLTKRMNENIFQNYNTHATSFYATYDKRSKKLIYCRAGHPFGIWYKKNEDKLTELDAKGMALGFFPGSEYSEKEIILKAGDKVVFYTDGIIEARNRNNDFFGEERLKNIILRHKDKSSSEISDAVMKALSDFIGEVELDDDVTLVVLEQQGFYDDWKAVIPSKLEYIGRVNNRVALDAGEIGFSDERLSEIQLALFEAISNAIKHGNKFDEGKKVWVEWKQENDGLRISVEDEGEGFKPANVSKPLTPENIKKEGGRGIHFIRQLAKKIQFNSKGNRITFLIIK